MNLKISSSTRRSLLNRTYTLAELARRRGFAYDFVSSAFHRKYGLRLRRGRKPCSKKYGGNAKLYRRYYNEVRGAGAWQRFLEQARFMTLEELGGFYGYTASRAGQVYYDLSGKAKEKLYKHAPPRIDREALKGAIKKSPSKIAVARNLGVTKRIVDRDANYWGLRLPSNGNRAIRVPEINRKLIQYIKQTCFTINELVGALSTDRNTLCRRLSSKEWRELKRYLLRRRQRRRRRS